jgi:2-oxo-4-hydroxy-4-carboxy-5-ureidoimidazoline decarboxylase
MLPFDPIVMDLLSSVVHTIAEINAMPPDDVAALLTPCVALPQVAVELSAALPFPGFPAMLDIMTELTERLSDDDVRAALTGHPRIGERTGGWSGEEQSGVDSADRRLALGNSEYEDKFGHIYLVCATGRDADGLLADLRSRLANKPADELRVVRAELAKITALRLARVVRP